MEKIFEEQSEDLRHTGLQQIIMYVYCMNIHFLAI